MKKQQSDQQRLHFFIVNVAAFALIFLSLGVIVLHLLKISAYSETDKKLESITVNSSMINLEIERYKHRNPTYQENFEKVGFQKPKIDNDFNDQVILWSKDAQILNKQALGGRLTQFQNLSLDKKNKKGIQKINLQDTASETTTTFHSITLTYGQGDIAYIQVLSGTNQIQSTVSNFRMILIISMVTFWIISIGISYYLSSLSMKPILASWKKQQEFVENASHELRTPLTIVQNSLQHLFTKPNHTIIDESESIAQALTETRRLTGLTNDLLEITRNDSNQLTLNKDSIEINEYIKEVISTFQEMAELDNKTFIYETMIQPKMNWILDKKKIYQVLVILLDNALKYTSPGDEIKIISSLNSKGLRIECQNDGSSISDEDKLHVFERFYREDKSRSKETGGYGLGLSIARQIVEEHKGSITVKDLFPKGVRFIVQLPKKSNKDINKYI